MRPTTGENSDNNRCVRFIQHDIRASNVQDKVYQHCCAITAVRGVIGLNIVAGLC